MPDFLDFSNNKERSIVKLYCWVLRQDRRKSDKFTFQKLCQKETDTKQPKFTPHLNSPTLRTIKSEF